MHFAEFTDPSYFVFANRAAEKKQEQTIAPGMTCSLFYGTMPKANISTPIKRDSMKREVSPPNIPPIRDAHGEMVNLQDPWQVIMETHHQFSKIDRSGEISNRAYSPLDPACMFFGL